MKVYLYRLVGAVEGFGKSVIYDQFPQCIQTLNTKHLSTEQV